MLPLPLVISLSTIEQARAQSRVDDGGRSPARAAWVSTACCTVKNIRSRPSSGPSDDRWNTPRAAGFMAATVSRQPEARSDLQRIHEPTHDG